jgi:[acyl-carrier-protein] S-malonyltransferase
MRIGVVFPGQGSQVVGMGADVAAAYPAAAGLFRTAKSILGYDLLALCTDGPEDTLRETRYSQPAIFVTNLALAMAVGDALAPVVSAGHSFGEYCSLTIARARSRQSTRSRDASRRRPRARRDGGGPRTR